MCMWFRVGGMSFSLLSDEEADSAEARWVQILNAVESGIVVARTQPFVWGGRTYARRVFFLSCREEPPSRLRWLPPSRLRGLGVWRRELTTWCSRMGGSLAA